MNKDIQNLNNFFGIDSTDPKKNKEVNIKKNKDIENLNNFFGINEETSKVVDNKYNTSFKNAQLNLNTDLTNRDYISEYDDPFNTDNGLTDLNELRANRQSWGSKASTGLGRVVVKVVAEVAKMPGLIGGAIAAPFAEEGEGWDTFVNNSWIKTINQMNEDINSEALPVYVKKAVSEGNLWDNISSIDFWATEGADGIGYIASMMVPGVALKGLGAGKYLSQIRGLKGVLSAQKADVITATVANTLFEAGAEAGNAMENFQKDMDTKLANGEISPEQYEEMKLQKARLGRDIFLSNAVILAGPNALQANMLWGKGINKTMSKLVDGGDGALAKTVVEPKLYQKALNRGKDVLKAGASEGLFEEAGQMTVENMFTNSAKKGQLTSNPFNDFNVSELGDSYLDTISSTEGQKAMFLGAFLGGGMQAYSGAKTDIADRKSTQSLLDAGNNAIDAFYKTMQTDLYNEDGTINSEKVKEKFEAFGRVEQLNIMYNQAVQKQDKEALEKLRDLAATQLAYGFIMNEDLGLEVLQEHLNASSQFDEIVQREQEAGNKTSKKDIIDNVMSKAKILEKAYRNFNDFAPTLINPTLNENQTQKDVVNFTNTLRGNYISNKANINLNENTLSDLKKKRQNILEDLEIQDPLAVELNNNIPEQDQRLLQVDKDIKEVETNLNRLKKLDRNFWNTEHIQKAFNRSTKEKKQLEKETSPEVVANNDAVIEQIDNVTSSKELEDLNLDISNPVIAEKHNERLNELKTAEEELLNEEIKVKEAKKKHLESFSTKEKQDSIEVEDVTENYTVTSKTDNSITFEDNLTGETITINTVVEPSENDSSDELYTPEKENVAKLESEAKYALPYSFKGFFKPFLDFMMKPVEKKGMEMNVSLRETELSSKSLEANETYKYYISNKNKVRTEQEQQKFLDSIPTMKELLFKWLPINLTIEDKTSWTGYVGDKPYTYENPGKFLIRKNIIDAIFEEGKNIEDLIVTISGQSNPTLNTDFENDKPVKNDVRDIEAIKGIDIEDLELFHIDKDGNLVPVTEKAENDFSVKLKEKATTQLGAIFLSIKNPLGTSVPVKLNINRVGELAGPLVDIYQYILKHSENELFLNKTLASLNPENVDPEDKTIDNEFYNNIIKKLNKEIAILGGNESEITLEMLIESIVKTDGSHNTGLKIIQDRNGKSFLEFKEGFQYSYEDLQDKTVKQELVDNISKNKYRNVITIQNTENKTQLDFKSKAYLEYLFETKVLTTNLKTGLDKDGNQNYAFKQEESSIWLEPGIKSKTDSKSSKPTTNAVFAGEQSFADKIQGKPDLTGTETRSSSNLENNSENIRNSQKNSVSLQEDKNEGFTNEYEKTATVENKEVVKIEYTKPEKDEIQRLIVLNNTLIKYEENKISPRTELIDDFKKLKEKYAKEYNNLPKKCNL